MLGQSKTPHQAEIDAACELIDFFRFNAHYARELESLPLHSPSGAHNSIDLRPLDGFVLKKDSPTCGLARVKVYDHNESPSRAGRGIFADAIRERYLRDPNRIMG